MEVKKGKVRMRRWPCPGLDFFHFFLLVYTSSNGKLKLQRGKRGRSNHHSDGHAFQYKRSSFHSSVPPSKPQKRTPAS
ncbi:MAG: hypothetical protein IJV30_10585, partial [Oscillospiraceae bacterium]|nr:hypothetical protein [Oscillospiraceae bacterium]